MWNRKISRKLPPLPWTVTLNDELVKIINRIDLVLQELNKLYVEQVNQVKKIDKQYEESMNTLKLDFQRVSNENQRFRRNIEEHDGIVAKLLGENEDLHLRLSECLKVMRDNQDDKKIVMCECCCGNAEEHFMLKCTLNHHICKSCINMRCKTLNESLDQANNCIQCCSIHECNGQILESQLCQTEEGRIYMKNYHIQEFIPIMHNYINKFSRDEIDRNIMFLKSDGTFRALQCRDCNYGPLLYQFCGDLEAHHGQQVGKNLFINNSCPMCNVLNENVENLPHWNGYS